MTPIAAISTACAGTRACWIALLVTVPFVLLAPPIPAAGNDSGVALARAGGMPVDAPPAPGAHPVTVQSARAWYYSA